MSALVGSIVLYGLILALAWGVRAVSAHAPLSPDSDTARQVRQRSESVCRLFNAPLPSSEWPITAVRAEDDPQTGNVGVRRLWSVDCTGNISAHDIRGQGAFVVWDARTGELYAVGNATLDGYTGQHPGIAAAASSQATPFAATTERPRVPNATEAVRAARAWLMRLRVYNASDPWVLAGPVKSAPRSWIVTWKRPGRTCLTQITAASGDLARFQLRFDALP